jgi:hypothetical protein
MNRLSLHSIFRIWPLLIGLSLVVGWSVPAFYDWTGSNQSRSSPVILLAAAGLLLLAIVGCAALPWWPIADDRPLAFRDRKFQFSIRAMLVTTAVVAVLLVVGKLMPTVVGGGLYAISGAIAVRYCILFPQVRWQVAALVACMYFPFAWVLTWPGPSMDCLFFCSGLPALLPTMLIGNAFGQYLHHSVWLLLLLSGAELVLGLWIIRWGPRRTIAYLLLVLLISTFGSFVLNALARI